MADRNLAEGEQAQIHLRRTSCGHAGHTFMRSCSLVTPATQPSAGRRFRNGDPCGSFGVRVDQWMSNPSSGTRESASTLPDTDICLQQKVGLAQLIGLPADFVFEFPFGVFESRLRLVVFNQQGS